MTGHAEHEIPAKAARRMRAARARLAKSKDHDAALELQHATRAHAKSVRAHVRLASVNPDRQPAQPATPDHLEALLASLL